MFTAVAMALFLQYRTIKFKKTAWSWRAGAELSEAWPLHVAEEKGRFNRGL